MIQSAVTVSVVPEARRGPFVFHDDVASACRQAAELGFDGVEVFASSGAAIRALPLAQLLSEHSLNLAAVGTGAGMVVQGLHLCDADADRRTAARDYIRAVIDAGAEFGAPAIIGSMQGRWTDTVDRSTAVGWLQDALDELGRHAVDRGTVLLYEPLNRYETNLAVTVEDALRLLEPIPADAVCLLADLFHMNIEEQSVPDALRAGGRRIGHVHFVDSNRRAAGLGHTDFGPIAAALTESGFSGYASAEAFPLPDAATAAAKTMESFRRCFRSAASV